METRHFNVTENHIKLLEAMWVYWDDSLAGAPTVDCKRPYGNKDYIGDINRICPGVDASKIHREMDIVVQILLSNASKGLQPGLYHRPIAFRFNYWERVNGLSDHQTA